MIDKNIILKTFNELFEEKCGPSKKEIISSLSKLNQNEKSEALSEQLSDNDKEYYDELVEQKIIISSLEGRISETKNKYLQSSLDDYKKENEDNIFNTERGIIEKKDKPLSDIDDNYISKFKEEDQSKYKQNPEYIGEIEQNEINFQQDLDLSKEHDSLRAYWGDDYKLVNGSIHKNKYWKEQTSYSDGLQIKSRVKRIKKDLDNAIAKSKGLSQDTIVYHLGVWNKKNKVGDKIKFKGYVSASYIKDVAEERKNDLYPDRTVIRFLCPTGTKGICASKIYLDDNYGLIEEHELFLGRNFEGTFKEYDKKTGMVTVLIDE